MLHNQPSPLWLGYPRQRLWLVIAALLLLQPVTASAQQRPLVTEDPETIGAGRLLLEAGLDYGRSVEYSRIRPGRTPPALLIGVSIGLSSIAEIQIDGGLYNHLNITSREPAPLSDMVTATGDSTSSVEDLVIATEYESSARPIRVLRLVCDLPPSSRMPRTRAESALIPPISLHPFLLRRLCDPPASLATSDSGSLAIQLEEISRTMC